MDRNGARPVKKPKSNDIFDAKDFPVSFVRRSVFQGTGEDVDEMAGKPLVAVVNSHTEMNPGHMHLGALAERVKQGVRAAGGVPFEFNVPAPCDGIAMGHRGMKYILAQRDLIADLVETHVRSMRFDAVVMIASCDKIVPGMIIAAARLDLPAIFITGGPNAMGIRFSPGFKGSIAHKDYDNSMDKFATATCATCGSCEIMGTANTFQCMTEALGLSLPGSATIPAFHADKLLFARRAGARAVAMIEQELTARKIITPQALENALAVDLAIGGSTNAALHLPAIAHAIGASLPLSKFNEFNKRIPTICGIAPNGRHGLTDLHVAGGIPAVMKVIAADLHGDTLCVNGKTVADIVKTARILNAEVIPPRDTPHLPEGGTVALFGNLAPDGSVIKQSAVAEDMRVFQGPARVFDSEADCLTAIRGMKLKEGEVLVIRYEGPRGGPGMPEMLAVTMALDLGGYKKVALVTDGRFSGATSGPCVGHVSPEAYCGGPLAVLQDGDIVSIDIPGRRLDVALSEQEIQDRLRNWTPVENPVPHGYMARYRRLVGSAAHGAVLD
jgi:dihydroxy-acid dehydratase